MSIPVLIEVYDEVRRLAIAGSAVAPGDFRLKKLIPPLAKSGEKAPVFAKVSQAVQAVVESNEKTAAAALLELTTLVNAILYTQGETGAAGEFKALETVDLGAQTTQASARVLKPLLEALNSTGSGRLELVRDAIEHGAFKDLRLVKPALRAIDDPYPEIGELVVEKVLPLYGKAILPELRAKLDIKGRAGHLFRLKLLHHLDPQGSRDLVQQVLADGSKEMKVAAIECLGTTKDDLVYLLEQSKAKARDVRAAAFRALSAASTTTADVIAALKKAIDSDDLELIVSRVQQCKLPEIQEYVLEQAEAHWTLTLKCKEKKDQAAAITRMQQLVSCLEWRSDAKTESFLLNCLKSAGVVAAIKSEPSGSDLNELIAHILAHGTPRMQQRLAAAHASLGGEMLSSAIFAARATMTPDAFYREFRPLLKPMEEKRAKKDERRDALIEVLRSDGDRYFYRSWTREDYEEDKKTNLPELDPRWLDAAVEANAPELVCALARPGNEAVHRFLSGHLAKAKANDGYDLMETMVRIGHPEATDAVIAAIKKESKGTSTYYYGYHYARMVADLPRSALPKLEELLATLPDKMVDSLMDSVLALKNKPE
jgi:hypothetical protein